jgi:hypothetical protein
MPHRRQQATGQDRRPFVLHELRTGPAHLSDLIGDLLDRWSEP